MGIRQHVLSLCAVTAIAVGMPVISAAADPDQDIPLQGNVTLYSETCPDGPKGADCTLSFFIEGEAAKLLFEGMRDEATRDECVGGTAKGDGSGLYCNLGDDGSAFCEFGYHYAEKRFGSGGLGC